MVDPDSSAVSQATLAADLECSAKARSMLVVTAPSRGRVVPKAGHVLCPPMSDLARPYRLVISSQVGLDSERDRLKEWPVWRAFPIGGNWPAVHREERGVTGRLPDARTAGPASLAGSYLIGSYDRQTLEYSAHRMLSRASRCSRIAPSSVAFDRDGNPSATSASNSAASASNVA